MHRQIVSEHLSTILCFHYKNQMKQINIKKKKIKLNVNQPALCFLIGRRFRLSGITLDFTFISCVIFSGEKYKSESSRMYIYIGNASTLTW